MLISDIKEGSFSSTLPTTIISAPALQFDFKHMVWGAKESMFKLYSIGGLDFKNHLTISSFDKLNQSFTGNIEKDRYREVVFGKYMIIEDYMLVYIIGARVS